MDGVLLLLLELLLLPPLQPLLGHPMPILAVLARRPGEAACGVVATVPSLRLLARPRLWLLFLLLPGSQLQLLLGGGAQSTSKASPGRKGIKR